MIKCRVYVLYESSPSVIDTARDEWFVRASDIRHRLCGRRCVGLAFTRLLLMVETKKEVICLGLNGEYRTDALYRKYDVRNG